MRKFLVLLPLVLFSVLLQTSYAKEPDTCLIGIHIGSLTDFKIEDQSFAASFWLWFNYTNDSIKIRDAVEIQNSKFVEFSNYSFIKRGKINWISVKCKAVVNKQWDVTGFPFDRQQLVIKIEHSLYDINSLILIPDAPNSKIDSGLVINEWKIDSLSFHTANRTYNSTFGDPSISGNSSFSSATAEIFIQRQHSWRIFFKMLTGVYVAFTLVLVALFLSPLHRLGLCVGGLFAAVGNKYIVESIIPATVSNTLFDNIHNLTFVSILIILIISVISFRLHETDMGIKKARKLDKISFFAMLIFYVAFNILLVCRAMP